jgi:GrpE protein
VSSMSSPRPSLVPAAGVAAFLALLTGGATWLASDKPLVGLIGLIGALASGAALLILTARPARTEPAAVPAGDADRGTLVQLCIYLRDRLTSTALATRLDQALNQVGVSTVEPTGERFDPSHHEAGGTLPTTDSKLVGMIATVEAPGYADRGVLLRPPVVTVYQRRQA